MEVEAPLLRDPNQATTPLGAPECTLIPRFRLFSRLSHRIVSTAEEVN
jgi:hypothetical protein